MYAKPIPSLILCFRYLPPELRYGSSLKSIEFFRCDVWALGLLCWEVVWDGTPYFCLPEVSSLCPWNESSPSKRSSDAIGHIFDLCPALAEAAARSIDRLLPCDFGPFQKQFIKGILRKTLHVDPLKRPHDLSELPFIFGGGLHLR